LKGLYLVRLTRRHRLADLAFSVTLIVMQVAMNKVVPFSFAVIAFLATTSASAVGLDVSPPERVVSR